MRINILAFAIGVGFLQTRESLPGWPLVLAVLVSAPLLLPWLGRRRQQPVLRVLSALACALLGVAWAALLAGQRLQDRLPEELEGRDLQVVGVVAALPHRFERGERFEFEIESVESNDEPAARLPRRIMLSWYHGRQDDEWREALVVRAAERWRFTVRLKRPHGNANPHGFDYEAWLFERGVRATGYVRPRAVAQRLDDFVLTPAYAVERLRERIRSSFLAVLPEAPYVGILAALAIGDQQAISAEQWRLFRQTGVTHLMSIKYLLKRLAGRYLSRL